jgi:ElaB/YqjD/DUF883 family membrane-anchored ribosome-binding protein
MDTTKEHAMSPGAEISGRNAKEVEQHEAAQSKASPKPIRLESNKSAQSFDWQACVKDHPYLTLGLAAGAGLLLVGLLKPRPSARKNLIKTLGNNFAESSRQLERGIGRLAEKPGQISTSVKAAAATMATRALKTYLKRRIINTFTPGHKRRMWF